MVARGILLVTFAFFSFVHISRASDASTLPSQKASVVIPLLEKIKDGDNPGKIWKILGHGLIPSGPFGAGRGPCRCVLDDGSLVDVETSTRLSDRDGIVSIDLKRPAKGTEHIYPAAQ
jgi:hypothetical protein